MRTVNSKVLAAFFVPMAMFFAGCGGDNEDKWHERILIVYTNASESKADTEVEFVKNTLKRGGLLHLNVDVCKNINTMFAETFAETDSNGNYYTAPAILNFVASYGWRFRESQGNEYIFVKERK